MKLYALIVDGGDGSNSISWFDSEEAIDYVMSDDFYDSDSYYSNEGSAAETLTLPPDVDLAEIGISRVYSLEDMKEMDRKYA